MSTAAPPTGRDPLPSWVLGLEHAQERAARAARWLGKAAEPEIDLEPAAAAVARVLQSIYDAMDLRSDRLCGIRDATTAIDEALAALELPADSDPVVRGAQELLREARASLAEPERALRSRPAAVRPEPRPFRASTDTPMLHDVPRASLSPIIRVPQLAPPPLADHPPLDKPKDQQQLAETMQRVRQRAAERRAARQERAAARAAQQPPGEPASRAAAPAGFARDIEPALSEAAFIGAKTRELFEEVALVGAQRAPLLGDQWRAISFLERRMLNAIDAIAALGSGALSRIEQSVLDAPASDPTRVFAAVMILGCVEGRDALAAAERVIYHLGATDPEVAKYAADALKLIPHPDLPQALRTMLRDPEPAYRALALEVLAYRAWTTTEELVNFAHDSAPEVVAVALPALAVAQPHQRELDGLLARAQQDPQLQPASWLAMALGGHPDAARAPAAALAGEWSDQAALAMALAADETTAEHLLRHCQSRPGPGALSALGWAGSPRCKDHLLELLDSGDDETRSIAAYALDRITGAQLYEEVEVDPETVIIADVPEPDIGEPKPPPLAHQVSDPRDLPSEGSPDTIVRPSVDPDRWRAFWREHHQDYERTARYRRGHGYTPLVSLWELDEWILTAPERRFLQHELVVRTGRHIRFDPHDLVPVQERALQQWQPVAQAASSTPGSWSRPRRRD